MARLAGAAVKSDDIRRTARFSKCGLYRWSLRRSWPGGDGRTVCFVMLNPSTADGIQDDPTIRRCIGFARSWGYSRLVVRNLFALRATRPAELLRRSDPVGGLAGDRALRRAVSADVVVCAWGGRVPFGRDQRGLRLLSGQPLVCLGTTRDGSPRHPLYVRGDTLPRVFTPE